MQRPLVRPKQNEEQQQPVVYQTTTTTTRAVDPRYYDPHYVDWSGWCLWVFLALFFFFVVAAFFIAWFVPYPYRPVDRVQQETAGGTELPGLGKTQGVAECIGDERYNYTTHLCEPRVIVPVNVDTELFDLSSNQCDSFFRHACGKWIDTHRPTLVNRADRAFGAAQKHNDWALQHIIESAGGGTPISNMYYSCVNAFVVPGQESQMRAYRQHVLQRTLGALHEMSDLPVVLARLLQYGFTAPVTMNIEKHPGAPELVPLFGNDGFSSHPNDDAETLFRVANHPDIARRKAAAFATLNTLIETHRPDDESVMGNSMASYVRYLSGPYFAQDIVYVNDVIHWMQTTFDVRRWLHELGMTFPAYHRAWIRNKEYYIWLFGNFGPFKRRERLDQWRAYVEYSVLYHTTQFFPRLPQTAFLRQDLRGASMKKRDDVSRITHHDCMRLTERLLPGHIGRAYMSMGHVVTSRVRFVFEALRERLIHKIEYDTHYMTPHDKRWTVQKLRAIILRVAEPTHWHEEPFGSQLRINDYMNNMDLIRRYRVQRDWERWKADRPLDRDEFQRFASPLSTVNAMYNPLSNTITVFAGILQYPFIHERYNNATLFATIGTVLGHELLHSLDPKGRLFDAQGSFKWGGRMGHWQRPTVTEYDKQVMCLVQEFGSPHNIHDDLAQHCPALAAQHDDIYGQHTITEDFSDVIAVNLAFETYFQNATLSGTLSSEEQRHQDENMWFYSFAQQWCSVATNEYECALATHDVHAAPRIRVDSTLRHVPYFQQRMQCPAHTYMHNPNVCVVF